MKFHVMDRVIVSLSMSISICLSLHQSFVLCLLVQSSPSQFCFVIIRLKAYLQLHFQLNCLCACWVHLKKRNPWKDYMDKSRASFNFVGSVQGSDKQCGIHLKIFGSRMHYRLYFFLFMDSFLVPEVKLHGRLRNGPSSFGTMITF